MPTDESSALPQARRPCGQSGTHDILHSAQDFEIGNMTTALAQTSDLSMNRIDQGIYDRTRTAAKKSHISSRKVQSQPARLKIQSQTKKINIFRGNMDNPSQVPVLKSTALRYNPDEDYKMTSNPRGFCLIINNVIFELGEMLPQRKGSDLDAHRFKKIFKQFGFLIETKRNLTAEKMKATFKQVSARCEKKHDALVIILLSHGSESGIYGTDGLEVDLNDILTYFDNKNCRPMLGKPKAFIVQACRGRSTDYGVKVSQTFISQVDSQGFTQPSQLSVLNPDTTKISRWSEIDNDYHPTRTDMVLCFSCHTGYVSTRNEDEGSWLGTSLAQHLQFESYKRHFIDILNMVSRDVRRRKSINGHKQVLEITTIGFDRNLYFNPGIKEDNFDVS